MRLNRRDTKTQASMKPLESPRPHGAKFHRQEDNRQQTASEQCSTASNPLSDADEQLWLDFRAKKRESKRIKSEFCKKRSSETAR